MLSILNNTIFIVQNTVKETYCILNTKKLVIFAVEKLFQNSSKYEEEEQKFKAINLNRDFLYFFLEF